MLRTWSRNVLLQGLWRTGALALTRPLCEDRLVILRYHSICADGERPEYVSTSISLPVTDFDRQMRHVSQHYRCISLDEAVFCLSARRRFPPRSIVVTFDDGYRDNYEHALPVLTRYRVPATIYLVSSTLTEQRVLWTSRLRQILATCHLSELSFPDLDPVTFSLRNEAARTASARRLTNTLNQLSAVSRHEWVERIATSSGAPAAPLACRWFLTAEQIREMTRIGITFGAHTVTHPNLPGLEAREARSEIRESRADLESLLGVKVSHFSYPNSGSLHPHFNDVVVRDVKEAGYRSAVTSQRGMCRPASDAFRLHRLGINRARSPLPRFSLLLESTRLSRASSRS